MKMFDFDGIQTLIGYTFKDAEILERAFTHSSYSHTRGGKDYQRLEFLGDSIIDFLIAEELCRRYPDAEEGALTKMRGAIVSSAPLAAIVRKKGYDKYIKMGFGSPSEKIFSDIFESLCGAIYLDGGIDRAREFALNDLDGVIAQATENCKKDYKTALYEKYPDRNIRFVDIGQKGEKHSPIFEVELYIDGALVARGSGGNKKAAQQECAKAALKNN